MSFIRTRRSRMRRGSNLIPVAVAALALAACTSGALTARAGRPLPEPPPEFASWGKPEVVSTGTFTADDYTFTQSPAGRAATVLFNNLRLEARANDKQLAVARTASIRCAVKVPSGKKLYGFRTDVRGFVHKS